MEDELSRRIQESMPQESARQRSMLRDSMAASPVFGGLDAGHISAICDELGDAFVIKSYAAGKGVFPPGGDRCGGGGDLCGGDSASVRSRGDSESVRSRGDSASVRSRGDSESVRSRGDSESVRSRGDSESVRSRGNSDSGGGGSLGIVLDGRLTVSRTETPETGGSVVLNVLGRGACFGVCTLFSGSFRVPPTVITASEPSAAAFLGEDDLTALLLSDREVCLAYMRFLTGRICFLNEKLHAFSGSTVNERVAQALLSASQTGGEGGLYFRGSMTELARRLNIARASLYRALDAMSGGGLIRRDGKYIEIVKPEELSCFK